MIRVLAFLALVACVMSILLFGPPPAHRGILNARIDDVTLVATGVTSIRGAATPTIAPVVAVAAATVAVKGTASTSIGSVTPSLTGQTIAKGALSKTLDAFSVAGRGETRAIIITGQSNAVGQGYVSELTGGDTVLADEYPSVLQADELAQGASFPPTWSSYDLQNLKTRDYQSHVRFGIEATMMRDLQAARPDTRWVVIKAAIGGTTLNDQWKASLGTFFPNVHDWIDDQIAAIGCIPAAYVWIQGENDAMQVSRANNYGTNLTAQVNAIRVRYPAIPFVYGRLHVDTNATYTSVVRTGQAALATTDSHMVDQDSGTLRADGLHYTTASVIALGHLYATAVLAAVPP